MSFSLDLARTFKDDCGAGTAWKDSMVLATNLSDPFVQRFAEALATSMTAWSLPDGIVTDSLALRGISVCVA